MPLPLPLLPPVTVIHDAPLVAVHEQPELAVTPTLPLPPLEPNDADDDEIEYVQGAPLSVMVNVWPAIVSDPDRELVAVLAATEYETVPLPLPLAPAVIVIHDVPLDALQLQPVELVTLTLPAPPA